MTEDDVRKNIADELALAESATFALGVAEIRPDLERARRFVQEARALLVGEGWIEREDVT